MKKLQFVYRFPNGYGASVICGEYTYNIETAVLHFNEDDKDDVTNIVYDTEVTNDVIGHQTPVECYHNLMKIYKL